jgi:hypothetical protein
MLNHACNPSARFHEMQTGRSLTVVAVTVREVLPGEKVTVSYGNRLWFVCRYGWVGCQHRHPALVGPPRKPRGVNKSRRLGRGGSSPDALLLADATYTSSCSF